jgi:hypothetical protein
MPLHKGGKRGSRKYTRNIGECKQYRLLGTREKNKTRKLKKHLKKHPDDRCAKIALAA